MNYEGNIIRPPSEADSIIIQATVGCSHNKCTFCGAYKDKKFRFKELKTIVEDIAFGSTYCKRQKRVFLADGDALILPQDKLTHIMELINIQLPWVKRISLYANAKAIRAKSPSQLAELKSLGLDRVYLGLESGHEETLLSIKKGESPQSMIEAASRINNSGLYLSVTVLLGIAGKSLSLQHARATGEVLSRMSPKQIAALALMPLPNTTLGESVQNNQFEMLSPKETLIELREIVASINCNKSQFFANHASNYLPISGRLGRDKQKIIDTINLALEGSISLKPESMRAL